MRGATPRGLDLRWLDLRGPGRWLLIGLTSLGLAETGHSAAQLPTAPTTVQTNLQTNTDATIRPLIPNVIALRRPPEASAITFDLTTTTYPPKAFPVKYAATPQAFSVFSSAATPWTVQMEVRAQPDAAGRSIPNRQLSFRVNEGPWIPATGGPQVVMSSVGPTPGWLPLKVEFSLELLGGEYGGTYAFDVAFTAIVLP